MLEVSIRRLESTLQQSTLQQQELTQTNQELRTIRTSLEEQVFARTTNLETVAAISEQLNQILNLDQLLATLVNQVKNRFNFYHVHVYLVDDQRRSLNLASGSGEVGQKMLAKGHAIPFNAPASLVARSARNKEIIYISDVRADPDWLYNPLLPDTRSEMAVPIVLDNQVVGVLDVQDDRIGGLDRVDTSVLRSLANQVAVAIRNARQFDAVQQALAETERLQQQYQQRAWQSAPVVPPKHVHQADNLPLAPQALTQLEALTAQQSQAKLIPLTELPFKAQALPPEATEQVGQALLVPITLQGQLVGKMQFLHTNPSHHWTQQEVDLLQIVADQVAQSADNLRLFEETRQRASREQAIREITTRLRAAPNLDLLVRTAAEELGQRLGLSHAHFELGFTAPPTPAKPINGPDSSP
jgi:GAF domain-containing protein